MKTTVTDLIIRWADERGHADHVRRKSQRTFSFVATRPTEPILFDLH